MGGRAGWVGSAVVTVSSRVLAILLCEHGVWLWNWLRAILPNGFCIYVLLAVVELPRGRVLRDWVEPVRGIWEVSMVSLEKTRKGWAAPLPGGMALCLAVGAVSVVW